MDKLIQKKKISTTTGRKLSLLIGKWQSQGNITDTRFEVHVYYKIVYFYYEVKAHRGNNFGKFLKPFKKGERPQNVP